MDVPGKTFGMLALGGMLTGLAVGVISLLHGRPSAPPADPGISLGAPIAGIQPIPVECRTATQADPRCTAAWEKHRHRFFGAPTSVLTQTASGRGEQP